MAYKLLEKKISKTQKRVDMRVLLKPNMFETKFKPYEIKLYIVSPVAFDDAMAEVMLQEVIQNKDKWKSCKQKECIQTWALKIQPRANAYISAIPESRIIEVSNNLEESNKIEEL